MAKESTSQEILLNNLQQFRSNNKNIIYKNILPKKETSQSIQADAAQLAESTVPSTEQRENRPCCSENDCSANSQENNDNNSNKMNELWQMYLNYAQNALGSLANNCGNENEEKIGQYETYEGCMTSDEIKEITPEEYHDLKLQLDRMENMLSEIHCCNQKLYKSLLEYCNNYSE